MLVVSTRHPATPVQTRACAETSPFPGTAFSISRRSSLVSKCLFPSTVILFAFIVGRLVFLNAGNKLPDKLEPVTISAAQKMSTFLTSRICSMVLWLLGYFPPSFPLFLPGALRTVPVGAKGSLPALF